MMMIKMMEFIAETELYDHLNFISNFLNFLVKDSNALRHLRTKTVETNCVRSDADLKQRKDCVRCEPETASI
jgi:hypothetical protein